jgi:hypothetical protein
MGTTEPLFKRLPWRATLSVGAPLQTLPVASPLRGERTRNSGRPQELFSLYPGLNMALIAICSSPLGVYAHGMCKQPQRRPLLPVCYQAVFSACMRADFTTCKALVTKLFFSSSMRRNNFCVKLDETPRIVLWQRHEGLTFPSRP